MIGSPFLHAQLKQFQNNHSSLLHQTAKKDAATYKSGAGNQTEMREIRIPDWIMSLISWKVLFHKDQPELSGQIFGTYLKDNEDNSIQYFEAKFDCDNCSTGVQYIIYTQYINIYIYIYSLCESKN